MTKAEIISYVKNLLPKIDKTLKYHDNVVAMAIDGAIEQVFSDMFIKDPNALDAYTKRYEDQHIKYDVGSDRFYIDLPVSVYNIPRKSKGVSMIKEQGNAATTNSIKYVPVTENEMVFMGDELGYVSSIKQYSVHSNKIWLRTGVSEEGLSFVNVSGIPSLNATVSGVPGVGTIIEGDVYDEFFNITSGGITGNLFKVSNYEDVIVSVRKAINYNLSSDLLDVYVITLEQTSTGTIDLSSGHDIYYANDLSYDDGLDVNTYVNITGPQGDYPTPKTLNITVSVYVVPKITLYLVPRFYDLLSTDDFNMPFGQFQRVTELAFQSLSIIRPKDLLTNNADANG